MASDGLILDAVCTRYGAGEVHGFAALEQHLRILAAAAPIALRKPEDILLSNDGLVQKQYRFTRRGLSTLCRRLCNGLAAQVVDLADLNDTNGVLSMEETHLAIRAINAIARSRFADRLLEWRMIVDPSRHAIDGVVSSSYAFLSNFDWLQSCQEFVSRMAGQHGGFLSASLTGRRLLMHFVNDSDWFRVTTDDGGNDGYRQGWSFSNSETGDAAVRVGMLIVDDAHNASLRTVARQTHTKGLRETRGEEMLTQLRTSCERSNASAFRLGLERMHNTPLPVPEELDDLKDMTSDIVRQLASKIPRSLARHVVGDVYSTRIVDRAPACAGGPPTLPSFCPTANSLFRLYYAITERAREQFPREQEKSEAFAYDLLRNRFQIKDPAGEPNG